MKNAMSQRPAGGLPGAESYGGEGAGDFRRYGMSFYVTNGLSLSDAAGRPRARFSSKEIFAYFCLSTIFIILIVYG
jgi:hypothetical protein